MPAPDSSQPQSREPRDEIPPVVAPPFVVPALKPPLTIPVARPIPALPTAKPLPTRQSSAPSPLASPNEGSRQGDGIVIRPGPTPRSATTASTPGEDDHQEKANKELSEKALLAAPPWLISMVVHAIFLILLALIYLPQLVQHAVRLDFSYAETEGVQLIDDSLTSLDSNLLDGDPILSDSALAPTPDPLAAPPLVDRSVLNPTHAASDIQAPAVGLALKGRDEGRQKVLLGAYGGTASTQGAVAMGLEWLKRNQRQDGSWSLTGPYASAGAQENRCAATAMALLAFQGAGHTPDAGAHKDVVAKGWKALLKMQDKEGNFYEGSLAHQHLYSHAQATIAICELYGMTQKAEYRKPAQAAIDYAVRIQAPEGGWRYVPKSESDVSVTGWFVMALQSARMAGLEVPSTTLDRISEFLDLASTDGGSRYAYRPGEGARVSMTAEALLCRQYLGWRREDPRLVRGVEFLLDYPINDDDPNVYYWYYATQVMHHMEGPAWKRWNEVMRNFLPKHQVTAGKERGSWDPTGDRWGHAGGRLYVTCLSLYMLEVYYRHMPIYGAPPGL